MSYTLSEKKVLKKLGIKDFRHMTKDKLVQFASMLPKMDPEVAKAALSQFPSFSGLAKDLTEQLSIMVGREFDLSSDSQKAFFDACNRILTSLEKELEDDDIDSDERNRIEDKMIQSRTTMDERIYGSKQKKDLETARNYAWTHLMHAALAIKRNNYFRTVGELEFVRKIYIDLLGDRYKLESAVNREIDNLPDYEKEAIKSTYITDDSRETLWACLINLTDLIYKELEGSSMPISKEMLVEYYNDLK